MIAALLSCLMTRVSECVCQHLIMTDKHDRHVFPGTIDHRSVFFLKMSRELYMEIMNLANVDV